MGNRNFINIDDVLLQTEHYEAQEKASDISRLIRGCKREYKKLSDKLSSCEVVLGVSAAVGCISNAMLNIVGQNQDIFGDSGLLSTRGGQLLATATIGSFVVAGVSNYMHGRIFEEMADNKITQEELNDCLAFEEATLEANEKAQAINYLKSVVGKDESFAPDDTEKFFNDGSKLTHTPIIYQFPNIWNPDPHDDFPTDDMSQ